MRLLALALAVPVALAPATLVAAAPTAGAAAPVTVARYTFDSGRFADTSGRGVALRVRTADGGRIAFDGAGGDRHAVFPAPCAAKAKSCPRVLLEGGDDPDLDPGTRKFRWGAAVRLTRAQVTGSSNVVQKGVVSTDSQWKLQIGAHQGKAHCVLVGRGSTRTHLVRSSVGVADNRWHDIMCRRSGTRLTVYVDGRDRGHVAVPAALSVANDLPLRIGGPNFDTRSDMYHGLLDDVYARLG